MVASYTFSQPERVSKASQDKIRTAAHELGYRPNKAAQALRTGTSGLLGVVVSEHLTYAFRDPGAAQFLTGVADTCAQHGKGMVLLPTGGQLDPAATVAAAPVDGYVFWTTYEGDPALHAAIETGLPVAIQGGPNLPGVHCVSIDDRAAAQAVAQQALQERHHPIVVAFPTDETRQPRREALTAIHAALPVTAARLQGITDALKANQIDPSSVPCVVLSQNSRDEARRTILAELRAERSNDAYLCLSDEIALGVHDALTSTGRDSPSVVTISGFDGNRTDPAAASIFTVVQDLRQQGADAAMCALADPTAAEPPRWHLRSPVEQTRP